MVTYKRCRTSANHVDRKNKCGPIFRFFNWWGQLRDSYIILEKLFAYHAPGLLCGRYGIYSAHNQRGLRAPSAGSRHVLTGCRRIRSCRASCRDAMAAPTIAHNLRRRSSFPNTQIDLRILFITSMTSHRNVRASQDHDIYYLGSDNERLQPSFFRARAAMGLLLAFVSARVSGQSQRLCESELGQADWT